MDNSHAQAPSSGPHAKLVGGNSNISRRRFLQTSAAATGAAVWAAACNGANAQELVPGGADGEVMGYTDTEMLPWAPEYHKHDPNRPWPTDIDPGELTHPDEPAVSPPTDAIVLFDGGDTSAFHAHDWEVENGVLVAYEEDIVTRESFGDCQLHLEWMAPDPPRGDLTDRGNSGVLMMERYEIQIFDSYTEKIYPDGIAGAIYGETPPMVHPIRPPGQWNSFDILFTAPVFENGAVTRPATVTMHFNGILVHYNQVIHGPVEWREIAEYEPHAPEQPLRIQEHGNPVRFRNIWIRPMEDLKDMAPIRDWPV
ncbi:MAG: DUF1080 domain-containing protein [Candidatus Hydrogenedentota bacterium]